MSYQMIRMTTSGWRQVKTEQTIFVLPVFSVNVETMITVHISTAGEQGVIIINLFATCQVQSRAGHFFSTHC